MKYKISTNVYTKFEETLRREREIIDVTVEFDGQVATCSIPTEALEPIEDSNYFELDDARYRIYSQRVKEIVESLLNTEGEIQA